MKNWRYYLITFAAVFGIGFAKIFLNNFFQLQSPILLFFAAITLSAWMGGFFHGILATVLSMLFIKSYFIPFDANWGDWGIRYALYFLDCFVITLICSQLRKSRNSLKRAYNDLSQATASLEKTESRIGHIFASNMIGIGFSNVDGEIFNANEYFLNVIGADQRELVDGRIKWSDFVPEKEEENAEPAASEESILQRLLRLQSGSSIPVEAEYLRKDGERVPVLIGAARAGDDMIVAFILDNSDRKRYERELSQNNERLEEGVALRTKQLTEANQRLIDSQSFLDSVIENIPSMIFVKEADDLKFMRFNRAGAEILGHPVSELLGKGDRDIFPEDQAERFIASDRKVLAEKVRSEPFEESIMTERGLRYLNTVKIPILDKNQEPLYLLGISEDITEKKQTEVQKLQLIQEQAARVEAEKTAARFAFFATATARLNESLDLKASLNAFAATIVQNMADWCQICFYDVDAEELEKIELCSFRHNDLEDVLREEPTSQVTEILKPVLKEGKKLLFKDVDASFLKASGWGEFVINSVSASSSTSLIVVPLVYHGNIFGTMHLISKDGDQYGGVDLAIAQDLAKRASLAIENARFYDKANEANRAKSAFLANMSHEIRTPLGAMLGFAELAMDDTGLSQKTATYISTILKNGHQLLSLVDEVLDISKIESEKLEIEKISFSPQRMIEDVINFLGVKAKAKGLSLNLNVEGVLPSEIATDPLRLRQILFNIIGNAIKFTEEGSVVVVVKFNVTDKNLRRGFLEFIVRDTGIGIGEAQRQRLFEPFTQADTSMTRKFGGTGLGLFLSRKLARLLNGDVILNPASSAGGSEFRICINVDYGLGAAAVLPEAKVDLQEEAPTLSQRGRVLVVEDSPENRIIVGSFLSKIGLKSDMAVNGLEGVAMARSKTYDVVFMDIQMPEMDGFEAITQLRREGYSGTVVALTAHAMKGDREKCLDHGFDDYLCKPISRQSLTECVSRYISVDLNEANP